MDLMGLDNDLETGVEGDLSASASNPEGGSSAALEELG